VIERIGPGIACALAAAAVYGLIPSFSRAAFENGVPSFETTFFRTALIAVAFAILAILRNQKLSIPRVALPHFLALATATGIISICYLAAGQYIPVGLAAIIFFTFPVLILLTAPIAEGHAPGWKQIAVGLFAFVGLVLATAADFGRLDFRGIALAGAAAIACIVQFYSGHMISRHTTPVVFGSLVHFAILPATLAVAVWVNGGTMKMFTGIGVAPIGYVFLAGVGVVYVFAYFIHMTSLRLARASIVAPFYNLEPMVTVGAAALLLGERLNVTQYLGGGMVLSALIVSSLLDLHSRSPVPA